MPIFKLNKLIRDKLPMFYESIGQKANLRVLNKDEHTLALIDKIVEEAGEITTKNITKKNLTEEIADIQQAIDDLKNLHTISAADIEKEQKSKDEYKGGFAKGIFIETLELQENDTWIDYYRAEPDRFPEVKKK
ncbi:MAG: nucleoside triphosphate pyrophosphohydrolase [Candidatus Saccharibacteria bacterium]|nr:nucleoside triphosphate pyrophosphohydrolase [Candidatus Saccharibacteria bacterium]